MNFWPKRRPTFLDQWRQTRHELQGKNVTLQRDSPGWYPVATIQTADSSRDRMTDKALAECYSKAELVFACVNELANSLAATWLEVGKDNAEGEFEPDTKADALALFYKNPDYSYGELVRLIVSRLSLTGASFNLLGLYKDVFGAGEFTPVPTHRVKVIAQGPSIKGYELDVDGTKPLPLKPEQMARIWYPDPARYCGYVSPLNAAARALDTDEKRRILTDSIMRNKQVPGGFIAGPEGATKVQMEQFVASYKQQTGGQNAGQVIALPGGGKYFPGVDVKDIDFSALNALTETRICAVFQVPPVIIGALVGIELGGKYSNYEEARRSFYRETIQPLATYIAEGLSRSSILADEDQYFRFDFSDVTEMQEDEAPAIVAAVSLYKEGLATMNEARAKAGMEPSADPEADSFKAPPPPPVGFGGKPGAEEGDEKKPAPFGKSACTCHGKSIGEIGSYSQSPALEAAMREIFHLQAEYVKGLNPWHLAMGVDLTIFNKAVIAKCREPLRKVYELHGKRSLNRIADRLQAKKSKARFFGKATVEELGIEGAFDLVNPEMLRNLEQQLIQFANQTNLTTARDLKGKIREMVEIARKTNSIADMAKTVESMFTDAEEWRARMIAVTESSRAQHDAEVIAADKSGVVKGFEPLIAVDACDVCQEHNGVFISLAEAKSQMGKYDRDLPPWHPNDQCSILEVLED